MIIECSNCKKRYKIQADRLQQGRVFNLNCKNCSAKIRLDLRKTPLKKESPPVSETSRKGLKDKILKEIDHLPPLPQVVMKLRKLIADPDSDAKKIAEVIETDQAIVTKVLKIANSSYYGLSSKISSIQHALVVLGFKTLSQMVTTAGSEGTLDRKLTGYGYDTKTLWKHSLAVAVGSKIIADMRVPALGDEAYTAGLIHDVGKIILDGYIMDQKDEIESFMEREEKTFLDAENHFFVFNHADIAYEVCKNWNFPESLSMAIKNHHRPSDSKDNDLQYILHMADNLARLSGTGLDDDGFLYEVAEGTMDHLDLKQEDVSKIVLKITESVMQLSA